ncbi:MAG TPA: hypothetical protein VIL12_04000 [Acidimicrobiia bacterium]
MERQAPRVLWLGKSVVAGAAGGLATGSGFRLAMRVAALAEGQEPTFTVGGTVFLLVAGTGLGVISGLVYGGVRPRLPGSGLGKGITYGTFLLMVFGLLLFADPGGEARSVGNAWVNLGTFGGSLLMMGMVIERVWELVESRQDVALRAGSGAVAGSLAGAATGLALAGVGLTRWSTSSPGGLVTIMEPSALFALLGLFVGSLAGLAFGLVRVTQRRRARVLFVSAVVGFWLVVALTVGEDGPRGSDRGVEIMLIVTILLGVFAAWTALLTDRLMTRFSALSRPRADAPG